MDERHASDEANNKADRKPIQWRHVFDWGFWTQHPLAVLALFLGGIFLASITNFPGGNPRTLWYFAVGLWIILGAIIWWIFGGIIAHLEGQELLTSEEIQIRDTEYKKGIQYRLESLESGITTAQKQLAAQGPRFLTASQRTAIKDAIAPFKGQKVEIWTLVFDTEGNRYAEDFVSVFKDAGWICPQVKVTSFPLDFDNVIVAVNGTLNQDTIPAGAGPLVRVLLSIGVTDNKGRDEFMARNDIAKDVICVQIGAKTRPISKQ